ncbi:uncharacterized protein LOC131619347 [Vicia villosa]|uniref:uncharacterized protein LOC131619347 n=1 Tax=Vicia villosa TaxID=3911 RepID=UPI00273CC9DD|nr:uncharacterized protein LOC131619347 [Vicia villosa]
MAHPDNISRELVSSVNVSLNVKGVVVKAVDVGGDFNNKQEFDDRESMLTWICRNATDRGFGAVIGRSDNGTTRRNAFATMLCERTGEYHPPIRKFKRDDTGTRKCEFPFKIRGYMVTSKKWRFNVICGLFNHDMCGKLQGHPNVKPAVGTKQVETNGGKSVKPGVIVEQIMYAWTRVVNSSTKELYADSVFQFQKVCEKYLDKVKENFVCAWTNNVRHLGNTTANRVESTHASLKNWLANSMGDFCRDWDTVNLMIKNKRNEIQTTFGRSIAVLEHQFRDNILYSQLIGNVSRAGLNYIFHEAKQGEIVDSDSVKCGCTITRTYGLLCAFFIAKKARLGEPIKMNEVIPHWKRLIFNDDGCVIEYLYYFRNGSDTREVFGGR